MNRQSAKRGIVVFASLVALTFVLVGEMFAEVTDVQVGIGGQFKIGFWTPIRVSIVAPSQPLVGRLRIVVPDGDGSPSSYESATPTLAAGQRHVLWSYVKLGRDESLVHVEFSCADGTVLRKTVRSGKALSQPRFVVSLGADLELDSALPREIEHRHVGDSGQVPDHQLGYDGVDVVFVVASAAPFFSRLTPAQRDALSSWTRYGGNLVVVASTRQTQWPAGLHPFSDLIPGTVEGVANQRQTTGIEQFAEASTPVSANSAAARFEVPMALLQDVDGRVEVVEGFGSGRPSIVRGSIGLGQSTFIAFDLSSELFARWPDRRRALAKVIDRVLWDDGNDRRATIENKAAASLGFDDLVGQLRYALDRFPGVHLIPFSVTAALIAVYIILIGPLDYWLLRRWRRPTWTWFTSISLVVVFVGAAVAICGGWKGRNLRVNQATVVDVDTQSGLVRGTTWAHLFAPETVKLDLDMRVNPVTIRLEQAQRVLSWQGLPGKGFGGMNSGLNANTFSRPYLVRMHTSNGDDAHVYLQQFAIATRASCSLLGQWWSETEANDPDIDPLAVSADSLLRGSVSNPLSVELRDAQLIYDRWAYNLGTLPGNGRASLDGFSAIDLTTLLNQRRLVDGKARISRWDAESVDVERILLMMMFYSSGKARSYTQMNHDFQPFIDISRQLTTGRAVLLGHCQQAAMEITLDGQSLPADLQHDVTFFRFLLPVRTEK